jgi:small subunit ribosomal protein S15
MIFDEAAKQAVVKEFATHPGDTGSPEVQVALLTHRVRHLTGHLKTHSKDHGSRRGLLMLVGKRATILRYLRNTSPTRYSALVSRLGLRH